MTTLNRQFDDPIVLILQLAAKRGFALMRQGEQHVDTTPTKHNAPHGEQGIGINGEKNNSQINDSTKTRTLNKEYEGESEGKSPKGAE